MIDTNETKQPALVLTEAEKMVWGCVYGLALGARACSTSDVLTRGFAAHHADEAIMALRARSTPATPTYAPDTTTHLQPGDEVRVIGRDVRDEYGGVHLPRESLDGPLNRPAHIPDAGEKVELPGKWWAGTGSHSDNVNFGNLDAFGLAHSDISANEIVAAANKLRELTFAAAFRAGIEAAAKVSPEAAGRIRAIPTPALD
jgi:hypothetical protein